MYARNNRKHESQSVPAGAAATSEEETATVAKELLVSGKEVAQSHRQWTQIRTSKCLVNLRSKTLKRRRMKFWRKVPAGGGSSDVRR